MQRYSKVVVLCVVAMVLCIFTSAFLDAQTPPKSAASAAKKPAVSKSAATSGGTSDQVFKNVQVLKGIPLDDFLGTMGIMSASLGMDCSECHIGAGTVKVDWAADTPIKIRARQMVQMMATINKTNFGGRQMVTCWSCHRGRDRPLTTPTLENVYGPPGQEMDDVLTNQPGQFTATQVLDKYLQAIGGADRLATVKSWVATGKSATFGGFGGGGRAQIFAQFPDKRASVTDFPGSPDRGDETRTFNGTTGWLRTPLNVVGEYELTGGELDGAKLDAQLSFPAQIKEVLTDLRVGLPTTITDLPAPSSQTKESGVAVSNQEKLVNVVQGRGPRGIYATLYFDQASGLLVRMVRYGKSPIGRIPTQIDYYDYRDVGGGIKMPFRLNFAWLDGRDTIQLSEVKLNVPIDESKFGRPAPVSTTKGR